MNDTRGQMYNAETLELFAVFLRQSTPKGKTKTDVLSADAVSGYVSAIRIYRSREARYEEGAGDVTGLYLRYQGELLGLWDPQNCDLRQKPPPETIFWLADYHPSG